MGAFRSVAQATQNFGLPAKSNAYRQAAAVWAYLYVVRRGEWRLRLLFVGRTILNKRRLSIQLTKKRNDVSLLYSSSWLNKEYNADDILTFAQSALT